MSYPDISILIPHKPGGMNDKALKLAIDSIVRFTQNYSYEIILNMTVPGDPYSLWNDMALQSKGYALVFSNSDVIFAPDWDRHLIKNADDNTIVTGYVLEPGNIGVAPVNIHANYGKNPDEFNETGFHSHVEKHKADDVKEERAWYMPCAMSRGWFLYSSGMFPVDIPFPNPNDILFWNRCKEELGTRFLRVKSYSYHFQNQSARP